MTDMSIPPVRFAEGEFRLGRVLRVTFSVLSRYFPQFVAVTAVASLPSLLLMQALVTAETGLRTTTALSLLGAVVALVFNSLGQAIVVHGAVQHIRQRPVRLADSMKTGLDWALSVVALTIIELCLGAVALLALVFPALILVTTWAVTVPVCVLERRGPVASLGRSSELTKGHRWRIFLGLLVPIFAADLLVTTVIDDVLTAPSGIGLMLVATLAWNGVWGAFYAVALAVAYHDLRVAKEGVDIEQITAVFD